MKSFLFIPRSSFFSIEERVSCINVVFLLLSSNLDPSHISSLAKVHLFPLLLNCSANGKELVIEHLLFSSFSMDEMGYSTCQHSNTFYKLTAASGKKKKKGACWNDSFTKCLSEMMNVVEKEKS